MRGWVVLSILLVGTGVGLLLYKLLYLQYPLTTEDEPGTWRVEQVLNVTGDGARAVIEAPLPRTSSYQVLMTEEVRSGPLRFSIEESPAGRRGRWSGRLEGASVLRYEVTFATLRHRRALPESDLRKDFPKLVSPYLEPSAAIQPTDPAVTALSRELNLSSRDKAALAREVFQFVAREIGSMRSSGPMDAASVAREGRGDEQGRCRLFGALSRLNQLPCRIVTGIVLTGAKQEPLRFWNEAFVGDGWVPFDVVERRIESLPPNRFALATSDDAAVTSTGTSALSFRYYVQGESQTYVDLLRRRTTDSQALLDRFSLLLLPVQTQHSLRFLLLVPLGALAMAVLRNVVGIKTFGTFMPMLIALAMTATGLLTGTVFLALIVAAALLTRIGISNFDLLLAPRIAFTLTFVVLVMVVLMAVGDRMGLSTAGVGAFPFVIMTMIVERISVSLEEEGWRNTAQKIVSTLFAIYVTYAVIQAEVLQTVFLVFPELLLVILGLLLVVGRYTGYRVSELIRFRDLITEQGTPGAGKA